jgi:TM2 domain-containing membrane protein YozV
MPLYEEPADHDDDDRPRRRGRDAEYEDDQESYAKRRPLAQAPKSRAVYIVLGIFLGELGIHNFYAGRNTPGFGQLALGLFNLLMFVLGFCVLITWILSFVGFFASFIWVIVELCTVTEDGTGNPFT